MATKLTMLGTGNALVTKCFNTCFLLETEGDYLMVDTGGGNGILRQLADAGVSPFNIHNLFLTHAHTDHVMGAIWIMRVVINKAKGSGYNGELHIYGHERVLMVLDTMCQMMLTKKDYSFIGKLIHYHEVHDKEHITLGCYQLQCFDILSTKEKQFGFRATLPDGKTLTCLGDEPYNPQNAEYAMGADWLMCEAFCLYRDRDIFHPYEKNHVTALEAGKLANETGAKGIIIYHTEDTDLENRCANYTAEAAQNFSGTIRVPRDLEVIPL